MSWAAKFNSVGVSTHLLTAKHSTRNVLGGRGVMQELPGGCDVQDKVAAAAAVLKRSSCRCFWSSYGWLKVLVGVGEHLLSHTGDLAVHFHHAPGTLVFHSTPFGNFWVKRI